MPKTALKFMPNLAGSLKTLITGREMQSGVLLFLLKIHGRFSDCKPLSLNLNWPWTFVRGVSPNISDELALSKHLKRMVGAQAISHLGHIRSSKPTISLQLLIGDLYLWHQIALLKSK